MVLVAEIFGPDLLIVVILAVVLLFGANRLPKMARSIGEASKEFKRAQDEAAAAPQSDNTTVTMTRAELEALIAEREAAARRQASPPEHPPA